jgi:hypothetical protein
MGPAQGLVTRCRDCVPRQDILAALRPDERTLGCDSSQDVGDVNVQNV